MGLAEYAFDLTAGGGSVQEIEERNAAFVPTHSGQRPFSGSQRRQSATNDGN